MLKTSGMLNLSCVLMVIGLSVLFARADVSVRTIALSGGSPSGYVPDPGYDVLFVDGLNWYGSAYLPVINNAGDVAFAAELSGRGIWTGAPGDVALLATSGEATPSGGTYSSPSSTRLAMNGDGTVAFYSYVTGATHALFVGTPGHVETLVSTNDGSGITTIGHVMLGAGGIYGFSAFKGTSNVGIWTGTLGGERTQVAINNQQAPGLAGDVRFRFGGGTNAFLMNDSGDVAFTVALLGTDVNSDNDYSLWTGAGAGLSLVAREGDAAPVGVAGVNYGAPSRTGLNDHGHLTFRSSLTGTNVNADNDTAIFRCDVGSSLSVQMLAREGQAAAGTGAVFESFRDVLINEQVRTAFRASVTGAGVHDANNTGVWVQRSAGIELVAREGHPAPGTGPGVLFDEFFGSMFQDAPHQIAFNGAGDVAFAGRLVGDSVDETNDSGIWLTVDGELRLLARTGDPFEVLPGTFRTITGLGFIAGSGNQDGRPSGFNDLGQIAFHATFDDGTEGLFTTVPEPTTMLLLAAGAATVVRRKRRT